MNEIEKLNMIAEWQEQHKQLIEDLDNSKKRIEELEAQIEKLKQDLEKENARLKLELEALDGQIPWKDIKDKSEVIGKLTEAKEIIKKLIEFGLCDYCLDRANEEKELVAEAEQFLKENE